LQTISFRCATRASSHQPIQRSRAFWCQEADANPMPPRSPWRDDRSSSAAADPATGPSPEGARHRSSLPSNAARPCPRPEPDEPSQAPQERTGSPGSEPAEPSRTGPDQSPAPAPAARWPDARQDAAKACAPTPPHRRRNCHASPNARTDPAPDCCASPRAASQPHAATPAFQHQTDGDQPACRTYTADKSTSQQWTDERIKMQWSPRCCYHAQFVIVDGAVSRTGGLRCGS